MFHTSDALKIMRGQAHRLDANHSLKPNNEGIFQNTI
jgi:hypothetical protein